MKKMAFRTVFLSFLTAFVSVIQGCSSTTCGEGTTLQGEVCLPSSLTKCGTGTTLVSGACKPVCGPSTKEGTNGCVLAPDAACGAGTVESNGVCLVIDPMKSVTVPEAAEPNNEVPKATAFTLPAENAPAIVLGGIIDAPIDTKVDEDWFSFTASALQVVNIEGIAVGIPALAIELVPADTKAAANTANLRILLDSSSRSPKRTIVMPASGKWILKVKEQLNALQSSIKNGSPSFSYIVKLSVLPAKTAKPLNGQDTGDVSASTVYSLSSATEAFYSVSLTTPASATAFNGRRVLWTASTAGEIGIAVADTSSTKIPKQLIPVSSQGVLIGVDYIDSKGAPVGQYELKAETSTVAVKEIAAPFPASETGLFDDVTDTKLFSVEVPASSIATIDLSTDFDIDERFEVRSASFQLIKSGDEYSTYKFINTSASPVKYYLVLIDDDLTDNDAGADLEYTIDIKIDSYVSVDASAGDVLASTPVTKTARGYFLVKMPASGGDTKSISMKMGAASATNSLDLSVSDAQLNSITSSYGSVGKPVSWSKVGNQWLPEYLLELASDETDTVSLAITSVSLSSIAEIEPNDDLASAQILTLDATSKNVFVQSNLEAKTAVDYFKFNVPTDGTIRIETLQVVTSTDTKIQLFQADGTTSIETNDDGGDGLFSLIKDRALVAGDYVLKVTDASLSSSSTTYPAAYNLLIQLQ